VINVVHTKHGKSFQGLVKYLLEGSKGAENPDRVAWTETRHLATNNPMVAANVMAATALDQQEIMREATIPTRKKSSNHVMHYTLSWPEGAEPSREEMMRAVTGSLAVLGETKGKKGGRKKKDGARALSRTALREQFATDHQVLVVAHEDTDNAHCHVVVNRVHPGHGVLLPTSHDFRRLSRWAQQYDHEFSNAFRDGELAVPKRAENNARRDAGDRVYMKRVPRDVYELEQASKGNHPAAADVRKKQRELDRKLARKSAKRREKWKGEWRQLEESYREQRKAVRAEGEAAVHDARRAAGEAFADQRAELFHEQEAAKRAFERNEHRLVGKAMNAIRGLLELKGGVNVLWSQGARREVLDRALEVQERDLEARVKRAKKDAAHEERESQRRRLEELGHDFLVRRGRFLFRHRRRAKALRSTWRTRQAQREAAWEEHRKAIEALPPEECHGRQTTSPDKDMERAARGHMERMRRRRERDRQRGRDDDRGR